MTVDVMESTGSGLPSAGWFADPGDPARERWWSGAGWTEHARPSAPARSDAAPVATLLAERPAPAVPVSPEVAPV
ncbi:DUF2510 domain-containing protein, partial [Homoserinibacter sp. GY 40078]|uniref:DUF2510 domain-containing protein n=1 Tax=Homoserinibacter sp. GY 40078 TaxID=2603275 RepID=UPI0011C9FE71